MNNVILLAFIATLGTWFVTAMGAATVVFFKENNPKAMKLMLGFSAGVMLAASFWSLLSPAIERAESCLATPSWLVAVSGFALGGGFMFLCDKFIRRIELRGVNTGQTAAHSNESDSYGSDEKTGTPRLRSTGLRGSMLLVISITLHNIPEGLAVGVAFGAITQSANVSEALMGAISIAVGIGLQNFPEGAAVSVPLRREGYSRKKCFLIGQATAGVEPVSGVIGAAMVIYVQQMLPYALSFAAGSMILVAVHELIPRAQAEREEGNFIYTMGILGGFALMMALDVALG